MKRRRVMGITSPVYVNVTQFSSGLFAFTTSKSGFVIGGGWTVTSLLIDGPLDLSKFPAVTIPRHRTLFFCESSTWKVLTRGPSLTGLTVILVSVTLHGRRNWICIL